MAEFQEFKPGSIIQGAQAWADGHFVVISGCASIRLDSSSSQASPQTLEVVPEHASGGFAATPSSTKCSVEVAVLKRGDSFGWRSCDDVEAVDEVEESWLRLQPQIVVPNRGAPLRVCRLLEVVVEDGPDDGSQSQFVRVASRRAGFKRQSSGNGAERQRSSLTPGGSDDLPRKTSKLPGPASIDMQKYGFGGLSSGEHVAALQSLVSSAPASRDMLAKSRLAQLWLTTTPPDVGIGLLSAEGTSMLRAHFKATIWAPLEDRLEALHGEIRRRQEACYRIHDCFPLQGRQINELKHYVMQLTDIWYGVQRGGNVSILYEWFIEAMRILGVTAYDYKQLPIEVTPDGWATVVDGEARRNALQGKGSSDSAYVATGGVAQKQGRSAIDNTVLRNLFNPSEARELLIGRRLRKVLCHLLTLRQRMLIRRLSEALKLDLWPLARKGSDGKSHRIVRTVLSELPRSEVEKLGIDPDGICFKFLKKRGEVMAGFGQLEEADQRVVWEIARQLLARSCPPKARPPAEGSPPTIWEQFVTWSRDYPGEFFQHDKSRHIIVKLCGIFSGNVVLVKRSAMERLTLARYFPLSWKRLQPLWGGSSTSNQIQVRPAGVKEASHVRANECPYSPLHGMALSAGGFASDSRCRRDTNDGHYTLLMEMQWVRDPTANIENWYITDIEKIVQEAWQLNPHGPESMMLPGEKFISVGQNPKVGSSIRQTQHTQTCRGQWVDYPILRLPASAAFVCGKTEGGKLLEPLIAEGGQVNTTGPGLLGEDTILEVVDVGPKGAAQELCGTMLRIRSDKPATHSLLRFVIRLRLRLLERLGNAESLDFLVLTMSDSMGGFVVIFAPIPQLVKLQEGHADLVPWANPLTGESSDSAGIQESRLDFGKGVGHFLVLKPALREQLLLDGEDTLRRIWGFNRIPGARAIIDDFILEEKILNGN
eukprot:TRINITY_DN94637_c0_g1_i1.p1 TRINITY_DN94637_c0_g1~~TRINITY_DN94637_c0_g1_i1.p1  ORF type:complete len:1086 (-),score=160.10 TRINITY_DN94637_c0_g1_i1:308-3115(-)